MELRESIVKEVKEDVTTMSHQLDDIYNGTLEVRKKKGIKI